MGQYSYHLSLSAAKSRDFCDCSCGPQKSQFRRQGPALPHCDVRVRWTFASVCDFKLQFRAENPFFLRELQRFDSGDAKLLAICDCNFWRVSTFPFQDPRLLLQKLIHMCVYIYIYMCVCVNGRRRFGGEALGGHTKVISEPAWSLRSAGSERYMQGKHIL